MPVLPWDDTAIGILAIDEPATCSVGRVRSLLDYILRITQYRVERARLII